GQLAAAFGEVEVLGHWPRQWLRVAPGGEEPVARVEFNAARDRCAAGRPGENRGDRVCPDGVGILPVHLVLVPKEGGKGALSRAHDAPSEDTVPAALLAFYAGREGIRATWSGRELVSMVQVVPVTEVCVTRSLCFPCHQQREQRDQHRADEPRRGGPLHRAVHSSRWNQCGWEWEVEPEESDGCQRKPESQQHAEPVGL